MVRHIAVLIPLLPFLTFLSSCYCEDCGGWGYEYEAPIEEWLVPTLREVEWSMEYTNLGTVTINDIAATDDDGFFLIGTYTGTNGAHGIYIGRMADDGRRIWDGHYGGDGEHIGQAVVATPDGGCLIAGGWEAGVGPFDEQYYQLYLTKIDRDGVGEWDSLYGNFNFNRFPTDMAVMPDGSVVITGQRDRSIAYSDALLMRVDGAGRILWEKWLGTAGNDMGDEVVVADDGTIAVTIRMNDQSQSAHSYWRSVTFVGVDGRVMHERRDTAETSYRQRRIASTGNDFIIADLMTDVREKEKLSLLRINSRGERMWELTTPTESYYSLALLPDPAGGVTWFNTSATFYETEAQGRIDGPFGLDSYTPISAVARTSDGGVLAVGNRWGSVHVTKIAAR